VATPIAPLCSGVLSLPAGGGDALLNVDGLGRSTGAVLAIYASQPVTLTWQDRDPDPAPCAFGTGVLFDRIPVPEAARWLRVTCPGATPAIVYIASRRWPEGEGG